MFIEINYDSMTARRREMVPGDGPPRQPAPPPELRSSFETSDYRHSVPTGLHADYPSLMAYHDAANLV
jgi:hypothetical protein